MEVKAEALMQRSEGRAEEVDFLQGVKNYDDKNEVEVVYVSKRDCTNVSLWRV